MGVLMRNVFKLAVGLLSCAVLGSLSNTAASAQARTLDATENCNVSGTFRHFRDNEFSAYSAPAVYAGSIGVGCDLFDLRGLPFGSSLALGVYGEVLRVDRIDRRSGVSGDMLTKTLPTMIFAGGTSELKLPSIGAFTPSILLRYGFEVGSIILPRGSYNDAQGFNKTYAMRFTQEMGLAGCVDYKKSFKLCGEYARLTYDTYPHIWFDPNGVRQGRPEAITVANEISGRIVVPFSTLLRH